MILFQLKDPTLLGASAPLQFMSLARYLFILYVMTDPLSRLLYQKTDHSEVNNFYLHKFFPCTFVMCFPSIEFKSCVNHSSAYRDLSRRELLIVDWYSLSNVFRNSIVQFFENSVGLPFSLDNCYLFFFAHIQCTG